ncbi:hypothetical protein ACWNYO_00505 [Candidatus Vidania fulgoroideorum]
MIKEFLIKKFVLGLVLRPEDIYLFKKNKINKKNILFSINKFNAYISNILDRKIKMLAKKKEILDIEDCVKKGNRARIKKILFLNNFYKIEIIFFKRIIVKPNLDY